jgi:GntR family transcriptional regulator/MocR family aminotransferase
MLSSTRSLRARPENTFITSGGQMAFYLLAQVLCSPGDRIIVESPGDPRVWSVFREAGAELVPVAVDEDGLNVPLIEAKLDPTSIRAVYLTPQRQYPTTVTLSRSRRTLLLELARRHRFAIIEHDEDAELQYEGPLPIPLAAEDETGCVIHVGTLSKLFSPGTRLGFIHAPEELLPHLIQRRLLVDRQGDQVLELAMADLLLDGDLVRHLKRMRKTCLERRNITLETLQEALGAKLQIVAPSGGMALWIRCPGRDADAWAAEALRHRIMVAPASRFTFRGEPVPQAIRLGFASHDGPELRSLTKGLAEAWRKLES